MIGFAMSIVMLAVGFIMLAINISMIILAVIAFFHGNFGQGLALVLASFILSKATNAVGALTVGIGKDI